MGTIFCWEAGVDHLGVGSGAIWLVAQRSRHVARMRLLTVSDATAGSDVSDSMAVGLSDPLGWNGATGQDKAVAYVTPPSGARVAGCM